ncbi:MAG TPA: sucrase ferredoxin [Pedococcus sp.]
MTVGRSARPSAGQGTSAPDACSVRFDGAGVSAYGTAARAGFWLAVEQAGPWGRSAATESHLPVALGRQLDEECTRRGGRLALLRAPGPHPDVHHGDGRTAYLAFSGPQPWLLVAREVTLDELASVDLDALAAGDAARVRASLPQAVEAEPILLVCTNGRRDVCCAVRGRPVALGAAEAMPGRVWESSHTGGHRFAPTGVLLPFGATLARLDTELCVAVLTAASEGHLPHRALGPVHDRGRSPLEPAAQAAESWLRVEHGVTDLTALATTEADAGGRCTVRHRDGRSWTVTAERAAAAGAGLPESCGKPAVPVIAWRVSG